MEASDSFQYDLEIRLVQQYIHQVFIIKYTSIPVLLIRLECLESQI